MRVKISTWLHLYGRVRCAQIGHAGAESACCGREHEYGLRHANEPFFGDTYITHISNNVYALRGALLGELFEVCSFVGRDALLQLYFKRGHSEFQTNLKYTSNTEML